MKSDETLRRAKWTAVVVDGGRGGKLVLGARLDPEKVKSALAAARTVARLRVATDAETLTSLGPTPRGEWLVVVETGTGETAISAYATQREAQEHEEATRDDHFVGATHTHDGGKRLARGGGA